jgi:hypothetical protein
MGKPKNAAAKAEPKGKTPSAPAPTAAAPAPTQPPVETQAAAAPPVEADKPFSQPVQHEPHPPADTPTSVHRLERARALPEATASDKGKLASDGIQSFKDADGRTMNVIVKGGTLHKQEVPAREEV